MSKETRSIKLAKYISAYLFQEEFDELTKLSSAKKAELQKKLREAISILITIK